MINTYDLCGEIINELATIPNVTTLKIGLEKGIGAKDCTFVRVVPIEEVTTEFNRSNIVIDVYIGTDDKNDFDKQYQKHFELALLIKERLHLAQIQGGVLKFDRMMSDSDIVPNLKVSVLNFILEGVISD